MDDRILALCELSNDMLFHKIPQDQLSQYVDASLDAGRKAAQSLAGRDILGLYRESGITILEKPSGKGQFGIILRGQATLSREGCQVEVYSESIQSLAAHSGGAGEATLSFEEALRIHLAHEYFHFLEYQQGKSVAEELPDVVTLSFLNFHRRAKITRCSEVAAHAFAQTLLGLPHLPNLYDYHYLLDTGAMTQKAFDALLKRMEAALNGVLSKKESFL